MCRKFFWISLISITCAGCSLFHYQIIPQEKTGPNGGGLIFIDQRIPEYIEFVATPVDHSEGKWNLKIYSYDKNLRPKSISRTCYIEVELPDGVKKGINLWSSKPFFWNKGISHLENTMKLDNAKKFNVSVTLRNRNMQDNLKFRYPYS